MSTTFNSLVGYGTSSGSDSDVDEAKAKTEARPGREENDRGREREPEEKIRNFLLESGFLTGSSDSGSEPDLEEQTDRRAPEKAAQIAVVAEPPPRPVNHKLPPPPLGLKGSGLGPPDGSAFANPFRERAKEHLNVLQKHVPLTLEPRPTQIGGRKICIGYRRDGRCRFGSGCKFAHDSDLQSDVPASGHVTASGQHAPDRGPPPEEEQAPEVPDGGPGKKRKVGLSDTLTPHKRALKQYHTQKKKEGLTQFP